MQDLRRCGRMAWLSLSLWLGLSASASAVTPEPALVPRPTALQQGSGEFVLGERVAIHALDAQAHAVAQQLRQSLAAHGLTLSVHERAPALGQASIQLATVAASSDDPRDSEAYTLEIDADGIHIQAPPTGQFYALQTLSQLLAQAGANAGALRLPYLRIDDRPRFRYRGMHLDVGRHLYPVDYIKRQLDWMARYKLNTFHWHLTEDQGWRIEIKRYPKLTEVGAWRDGTSVDRNDMSRDDGVRYGGYYTQDEVREVVAYAAQRHITVIPEIEMPGHSMAALAAYPELACTPGPFEVGTTWGVYEDIYCPKEQTFEFLQNVLDEVIALFPGEYVHIGGDEAPKTRWKDSAVAQAVIRHEGLKDEHELQSWFIRRIERFLHTRGRRLIGWEEILEGGLAPDATVMSWRGEAGGIAAARQGHDVIMTPTQCCYFDYGQGPEQGEAWGPGGELTLARVYAYDPVPAALSPQQAMHVLGVQGNVWTEWLRTPEMVDYMSYPRMLALAEVAWTPQHRRAFDDFQHRLSPHYRRLAAAGIHYRVPDPLGLRDMLQLDREDFVVELQPGETDAHLYYTVDGSTPDASSPRYREPLKLRVPLERSLTLKVRTVTAEGRSSGVKSATLRNRDYLPSQPPPAMLRPGMEWQMHEGVFSSIDALEASPVIERGVTLDWDPSRYGRDEAFGLVFGGWLRVPEDGVYRFATQADDRSRLYIDGEAVVRNDSHDQTVQGDVPLRRGWHRLRLAFYQRYGGIGLNVYWARADGELQALSPAQLSHQGE